MVVRYNVACRGGRVRWSADQPRFEGARDSACGGRRISRSSRVLGQVRVAVGGSVAVRGYSASACRRIPYYGSHHAGKSVVAEECGQVRTNDMRRRRDTSRVLMLHVHWERPRSEVESQGAVPGGLLPEQPRTEVDFGSHQG